MKIKILALSTLFLASTCAFSATYSLYNKASTDSKIVGKLDTNNQGDYFKFHMSKDSNWAKYANSKTGDVGWLDLNEVDKHKADDLRKRIIKNIDENIKYYQEQIDSLNKVKTKVSTDNYSELQKYGFTQNINTDYFTINTSSLQKALDKIVRNTFTHE
jgi:hypothetical protein